MIEHTPGTVPHYQLGKPIVWKNPKGNQEYEKVESEGTMKTRTKYIMIIIGFPIIALGMLSGLIWALFMGGRRWMLKRIVGV